MALQRNTPLKKGSKGLTVTILRRILAFLGYPSNDKNGTFGIGTENAVKVWQKNNRKKDTGQVTLIEYAFLLKQFIERLLALLKNDGGKNYVIPGRVINEKTELGISKLRIEAWSEEWITNDTPLGLATSEKGGWFNIKFESEEAQAYVFKNRPTLFFRVYDGKKLLTDTVNSLTYNVGRPSNALVIPVAIEVQESEPPKTPKYIDSVIAKFPKAEQAFVKLLVADIISFGKIKPVEQLAEMNVQEIAGVIDSFSGKSKFFNFLSKDILSIAKSLIKKAATGPELSVNVEHINIASFQAKVTANQEEYNKAITNLNKSVGNQNLWQGLVNRYPESQRPIIDAFVREIRKNKKQGNFVNFFERVDIASLLKVMVGMDATHPFIEGLANLLAPCLATAAAENRLKYGFVAQVINTDDKKLNGIPGLKIQTQLLFPDAKNPVDLGFDYTNTKGFFGVDYSILSDKPKVKYPFLFTVFDEKGNKELLQKRVVVSIDQKDVVQLKLKLEEEPVRRDVKLENLPEYNKYPKKLRDYLAQQKITNVTQIAAAGGIQKVLEGSSIAPDSAAAKKLDAHTQIGLFSTDVKANEALVAKGYTGIKQIASTPRDVFIADMKSDVGEFKAYAFQAGMRHSFQYLNNLMTYQYAGQPRPGFPSITQDVTPPISCECEDCNSAVSPLAYLAELLDYVLDNVKNNGNQLVLNTLDNLFNQPFGDLPASCELMEQRICQIRLATEILWKEYHKVKPGISIARQNVLTQAVNDYTLLTYQTLLEQLGTSYEEIRLIRYQRTNETIEEYERRKKQLADRIGIDLFFDPTGTNINTLATLFKDPATPVTEADLEQLFGYRDTQRDVLTATPVSDFEEWRLAHLRTLWKIQDWIEDDFSRDELPVLDPDVVGIDDFRKPIVGETVFDIWKIRRDWVDGLITSFAALTKVRGIYPGAQVIQVPSIDLSTEFNKDDTFDVNGSTGNDGTYTIISVKFENSNSYLAVQEAISNVTADGDVDFDKVANIFGIDAGANKVTIANIDLTNELQVGDNVTIQNSTGNNGAYTINTIVLAGNNTEIIFNENIVDPTVDGQILYRLSITIGGIIVPDFDTIFSLMYQQFTYSGNNIVSAWNVALPANQFETKYNELENGTTLQVETVINQIKTNLGLEVDAFKRLIDIYKKDKTHANKPDAEQVSLEEWEEVYNILTQVVKEQFYDTWIQEESANNIELNPRDFWKSIKEPSEGKWSVINLPSPLIDPGLLSINDLPEFTAGQQARQIHSNNVQTLETDYLTLKADREANGVSSMMQLALGHPNSGDPLPHDIDVLEANLSNSDPLVVTSTETNISTDLFMSVDEFKRMLAIRTKQSTDTKPTETEWKEIYEILTSAQKKKRRYPVWIATEQAVSLNYWEAYKAQLPKWRASFEYRAKWQNALKKRSESPIVDPNVLFPVDFDQPIVTSNPAFAIWSVREILVNDFITTLDTDRNAQANDLAGIEYIIETVLEVNMAVVDGLKGAQNLGEDIRDRLTQLNLTLNGFEQLLVIRQLVQNGNPILNNEWEEVYHILTRIWKERSFRDWQIAEENSGVTHSPDFFKMPEPAASLFPIPEPLTIPTWLTSPRDRRNWQRTLRGRIEEEDTTKEAIQNAIEDAEDVVLQTLRDAIIKTIGQTPKYLTDHLLIDTENNCCQKTTRISQAIESLQVLLWSLHLGILEDTYPDITLHAPSFEEEWQWIGSYSAWRAAMFVFIYPENILLPSLRKWQSPGFRKMVNDMRSNRRLNPDQACEYAKKYSRYYKDICNLTIGSTCKTNTRITHQECRKKSVQDYVCLFYKFALSDTHKVYWSVYNQNDNSGYADTHWDTIPGLEDNVMEIVGSPSYKYTEDERFIYLFLIIKEGKDKKLGFVKFNLETQSWDSWEELDVPKNAIDLRIVAIQSQNESFSPSLVIKVLESEEIEYNGSFFKRSLDVKGDDWEEGDWEDYMIVTAHKGKPYVLKNAVAINDNEFILITSRDGNTIRYRIFGGYDDGYFLLWTNNYNSVNVSGATFWKNTSECFVFYNYQNIDRRYRRINRSTSLGYTKNIDSISEFDNWMASIFGLSFKQHTITDSTGLQIIEELRTYNIDVSTVYDMMRTFSIYRSNTTNFFKNYIGGLITWITEDELQDRLADWRHLKNQFSSYESNNRSLNDALKRIILDGNSINIKSRDKSNELDNSVSWTNFYKVAKDYGANLGKKTSSEKTIAYHHPNNRKIIWRNGISKSGTNLSLVGNSSQLIPNISAYYEIPEIVSENGLPIRKANIEGFFQANASAPSVVLDYLREAYYFVPMHLGIQLQNRSHYISALSYFKTVYDYTRPDLTERKIYYGLVEEESLSLGFSRAEDWMLDPLNPHAIASSRANVYTSFTILTIARCILEYGDAEFTYDTTESVPRARNLYEESKQLLEILKPQAGECENLIGQLGIEISDGKWQAYWEVVIGRIQRISDLAVREEAVVAVLPIIQNGGLSYSEKFTQIESIVKQKEALIQPISMSQIIADNNQFVNASYQVLAADAQAGKAIMRVQDVAQKDYAWKMQSVTGQGISTLINGGNNSPTMATITELRADKYLATSYKPILAKTVSTNTWQAVELSGTLQTEYVPRPFVLQFCIPRNPIIKALCLKADMNLYKIRNCMNIAGIERKLDPYAAPTDTTTGLPTIGAGGQLILPGTVNLPPTPYRYKVLLERAKQLVSLAQQVEASFLSALEKYDAESYTLLKARQDLEMAKAGIRLQDLRVREAKDGVKLSELQLQRSEVQIQELDSMISRGLLASELSMVDLYYISAAISSVIAAANAVTAVAQTAGANIFSEVANKGLVIGSSIVSAAAQIGQAFVQARVQELSLISSFERRKQEWDYQKTLAQQDVKIGRQQIKISEGRVRIVGQEREIAELQKENAKETIEFLKNKFTNAELYDWMSNVLEGVYSFFLQQATTTAQQAVNQLAFERQELPPPFIQADYWEPPASNALSSLSGGSEQDRRGLTGSARLLQDIYQLDQYAFDNDSRKQQLSKTISLATYAPVAFQMFKDTGVMTFATPMEMFDRDFPGHYLRLIKKVKVSVIALIPPTEGIKATLTNSGLSRVVIWGDIFQNVQVRRSPEVISLTSPREATGMFDLQQENEFLNPFESQGVDTFWEFRMEKASNFFDYRSIADVLITIDYTAFNSFDYRRQVTQNLGSDVSLNHPFSMKNQFADQWYDLHNPDYTATPMAVKFSISQNDFPPNISDLAIQQVALYFAFKDQNLIVPINLSLKFQEEGTNASLGGGAVTDNGLASTLQGNAGSWIAMIGKLPFGEFELDLTTERQLFQDELIDDILLVVTYNGFSAEWNT